MLLDTPPPTLSIQHEPFLWRRIAIKSQKIYLGTFEIVSYEVFDRYQDLMKQYEALFTRMLHVRSLPFSPVILEDDHMQWTTLHTNMWTLLPNWTFLPNLTFSAKIARSFPRPWHAKRRWLLLWPLVLSHFWTCICSNVETNISQTCLVSRFQGLLCFIT